MSTAHRFVADDGVRLAATLSGADGPGVLLLSGGPGMVNYLPTMPDDAPLLAAAPDPRGVGASEGGPHDLARSVADLEALRADLGVERWIVVGHSSGADLGLHYACEAPGTVARLVSVCGTGIQDDRGWHAAYEQRQGEEPDLGLAYDADVHRAQRTSWREWIHSPDLFVRLRRLEAYVDLVAAEHDIRPPWPLAQLAGLLRTELRTIPGVGHDFWHTHPDLWTDLVLGSLPQVLHPPTSVDPARERAERHAILAAIERAVADPHRVVELVLAAPDVDGARQRLADELGVDEVAAGAVLDLQWRRLTRAERDRLSLMLAETVPGT